MCAGPFTQADGWKRTGSIPPYKHFPPLTLHSTPHPSAFTSPTTTRPPLPGPASWLAWLCWLLLVRGSHFQAWDGRRAGRRGRAVQWAGRDNMKADIVDGQAEPPETVNSHRATNGVRQQVGSCAPAYQMPFLVR